MSVSQRSRSIEALMQASGVRFGTSGVRGRVVDLTDEVCFAYVSAFLQTIGATSGSVALAIDLRPSSPAIAAACASAIEHAGLSVDYCGAIPTPALALHAQTRGVPAVMVTGSHIPFDRNGIKFYDADGEITKLHEEGICRSVVVVPDGRKTISLPPVERDAYRSYVDRYLRFFPAGSLAGMRLAVYEHSSVARDMLHEVLVALGAETIVLGRSDDFVPIDTEAVSEADARRARAWAREHRFSAILSTDGDADRPLLGDENGAWLRGDIAGILCAQYLGARAVVTTLSCNTAVELCGAFAQVIRTRIGSPHVIAAIAQLLAAGAQGVIGFEPNGGFLLGPHIEKGGRALAPLLTRDAMLPLLCLLCMANEKGCKVSELAMHLPARFTASDRLPDFPTAASRRLLSTLADSSEATAELFAGLCGKPVSVDQTDGLRIVAENGEIVHFRASGNAPELRCYVEAGSGERSEFLLQALLRRLAAKA